MADFNLSFPSFKAEDMGDEKQTRKIIAYLKSLHEQLAFMFTNLDEDNLSGSLRARLDNLEAEDGQDTEDG